MMTDMLKEIAENTSLVHLSIGQNFGGKGKYVNRQLQQLVFSVQYLYSVDFVFCMILCVHSYLSMSDVGLSVYAYLLVTACV